MIPLVPFVCVAYFVLYTLALSIPNRLPTQITFPNPLPEGQTLDVWIERQEKISVGKLLDNVAPGGKNTKDAVAGTVIASPSTSSPDYYFQCIYILMCNTGMD
jgi:glucoamylase